MVGLLVGPNGPLAWAGEAIMSLDQMAYAEGGLGPSIGACLPGACDPLCGRFETP